MTMLQPFSRPDVMVHESRALLRMQNTHVLDVACMQSIGNRSLASNPVVSALNYMMMVTAILRYLLCGACEPRFAVYVE